MQCVWWLSVVFILGVCGSAVDEQDWELTDCDGLDSWDQITECIWQARLKQLGRNSDRLLANLQRRDEKDEDEEREEENRLTLGFRFSTPSQPDVSPEQPPSARPERSGDRPTYSMEHFRWGKPMNRKRRPVKVRAYVTAGDEDSMETPIPSLARRQLLQEEQKKNANTKNTTKYRISHFRWNAPSATKRYSSFVKQMSERSYKPLLALLRNIITT